CGWPSRRVWRDARSRTSPAGAPRPAATTTTPALLRDGVRRGARGRPAARTENHIHGRQDLADTIARLQAYQEAGADVLYAPGLIDLDDIRQVVTSVDRPVNVLVLADGPTVAQLAEIGVRRISVGGWFA